MADWISVLLGGALIHLTVAGTVLVSFQFLWSGHYVLAGALLLPLLSVLAWYGADSFLGNETEGPDDWR